MGTVGQVINVSYPVRSCHESIRTRTAGISSDDEHEHRSCAGRPRHVTRSIAIAIADRSVPVIMTSLVARTRTPECPPGDVNDMHMIILNKSDLKGKVRRTRIDACTSVHPQQHMLHWPRSSCRQPIGLEEPRRVLVKPTSGDGLPHSSEERSVMVRVVY